MTTESVAGGLPLRRGESRRRTAASRLAVVAATAAVLAGAAGFHLWLTWDAGAQTNWMDARHYLGSAHGLVAGRGLSAAVYDVAADAVRHEPLTYYPPLTSLVLALLLALGVPSGHAAIALDAALWPLFLAGLAALTLRLSGSRLLAWAAAATGAVTWPFWAAFVGTASEAMFLPLLVWTVFLAVPLAEVPSRRRLVVVAALAGLLLLTRYVGVFVVAALVAWWWTVGHRFGRRERLTGTAILAASGIGLAAWVGRNLALTGHPFGAKHLGSHPSFDFVDTLAGLVRHGTWVVLPSVRPGAVLRELGWPVLVLAAAVPVVVVVLALGVRRRRRQRQNDGERLVLAIVASYVLVFLIVQPLVYINPMDWRYMTVVLCLVHPWALAQLRWLAPRARRAATALWVGVPAALLAVLAAPALAGESGAVNPAAAAGRSPRWAMDRLLGGTPTWLVHRPPRQRDVAVHLPELAARLAADDVIVSNAADLFADRPLALGYQAFTLWLDEGVCTSRHRLRLVIVDWNVWRPGEPVPPVREDLGRARVPAAELLARAAAKCPGLRAEPLGRAWLLTPAAAAEGGR